MCLRSSHFVYDRKMWRCCSIQHRLQLYRRAVSDRCEKHWIGFIRDGWKNWRDCCSNGKYDTAFRNSKVPKIIQFNLQPLNLCFYIMNYFPKNIFIHLAGLVPPRNYIQRAPFDNLRRNKFYICSIDLATTRNIRCSIGRIF